MSKYNKCTFPIQQQIKEEKMDEQTLELLKAILAELRHINEKLGRLTIDGQYSIHDICNSIDRVESAVNDVYDPVNAIETIIESK